MPEYINKLEESPTGPSSEETLQRVPPSKPRTTVSSGKLLLSCECLGTGKQDGEEQKWPLLLLRGAIPHASALGNPIKPKLGLQGHPIPSPQPKWRPRKMAKHSQEDSQHSLSSLGSTRAHACKKRRAQMQNCKADLSEDTLRW